MGHALGVTIQDILIRWRRMAAYNALWLPGTDHAGIATQMVVERELQATERQEPPRPRPRGVRRARLGVEGEARRPHRRAAQGAGRSLDWERERFTMDERLLARRCARCSCACYEEGLIYRAQRLINWCPSCRTALSDLEVEHDEETQGELWRVRLSAGRRLAARWWSPRRGPRRCWATPRWRCTPTIRAHQAKIGKTGRAARSPAARFPIIGDADPGRPEVRHRRGQGDAGARLQRLRDRPAPRPADDLDPRRDGHGQRRGPAPFAGLDRVRGAQGGQGATSRQLGCSSAAEAARARASAAASAARRVVEPMLSTAVVRQDRAAGQAGHRGGGAGQDQVRPRELDQDLLALDDTTSATGASRASCGGATASRPGTAAPAATSPWRATTPAACAHVRRRRARRRTRTCSTPGSRRRCGRSRRSAGPSETRELKTFYPTIGAWRPATTSSSSGWPA